LGVYACAAPGGGFSLYPCVRVYVRVRLWGTSWAHASYVRRADADGKTIGVHPSSLGSSRRFHAASSTLLMSAFRETREGVSEMFASVGTQSKRARTPREHSASLTEFAILAMSSLSAYPCTQADKAEQLSTNHRARRFRNSSGKVRRAKS
jgi:hypothetical protein